MACNCEDCCKNYKTCEILKEYGAVADIYYLAENCKDFEHKELEQ